MSNDYKISKDVPDNVLIKRLDTLSDAITRGETGLGEFTMRIPAEVDRDADLILSEAAQRLKRFSRENKIMRKALEKISKSTILTYSLLDADRVLSEVLLAKRVTAGNALEELIDHA